MRFNVEFCERYSKVVNNSPVTKLKYSQNSSRFFFIPEKFTKLNVNFLKYVVLLGVIKFIEKSYQA